MAHARCWKRVLVLALCLGGCGGPRADDGTGADGDTPAGGSGGAGSGGRNTHAGQGGTPGQGATGAGGTPRQRGTGTGGTATESGGTGTGGTATESGGAGGSPDAADAGDEDAPTTIDAGPTPPDHTDYGAVGQHPQIALQYPATPVGPIVAAECPGDPTAGFTEYQGSFVVQRPYDLTAADRFKYEDGIYTFWVQSNDKPHQAGNTTKPRTEARYTNFSAGEHIWSADVMYETPSKTCVMQIHNVVAAIAMYLRVQDGRMFNLSTGKTVLTDYEKKWFNLKVAFNTQTRQVRIYVDNCLKETSQAPSGTPDWYFKNGVYTCDSGTCRSHYKNVHLYQKGGTEKPLAQP
jgi:hypothetical protein